MQARSTLLLSVAFALLASTAVAFLVFGAREKPPLVQGVFIPDPLPLAPFELKSHKEHTFNNEDFSGHWSILSYGYTSCPDICPTTLATLAQVDKLVRERGYGDTRFYFYTVDPQRDTLEKLAQYVPYFNPEFVGLRGEGREGNFEKGLGISAMITPLDSSDDSNPYEVAHGVHLYLLNPEGHLQAVFRPETDKHDRQFFRAGRIVEDYLAIRKFTR